MLGFRITHKIIFCLLVELQKEVADVPAGVLAKGDMGDPEVGAPVFAVGVVLGIGTSIFSGLGAKETDSSTQFGRIGLAMNV
jgi:hypothetical protein